MNARHQRLVLLLALALGVQSLVLLAAYLAKMGEGARFGGDFISFWTAAQRLGQGSDVYDVAHWRQVMADGGRGVLSWFVYPPFALFGLWPLAGLSYDAAVAWWSGLPIVLLLPSLWILGRRAGLPGNGRLALIAFTLPFLAANLFSGQTGAILALLWCGLALSWRRRPVLAGILIGLLTIKPQLGLLIPVALIAARQWTTFTAAAVIALVLVAAATLAFGPAIWFDYLAMTRLFGDLLAQGHDRIATLVLGPFVSLKVAGVPTVVAAAVQGAITLALVAAVVRVFRSTDPEHDLDRIGLLATASLLATPYSLAYDMPILAVALLPLLARVWREGMDAATALALGVIVTAPLLAALLGGARLPIAFLALCLLFLVQYRALRQGRG